MNCIRLTFSLEMFFKDPLVEDAHVKANPHLRGKHAMEIFDETIRVMTECGLMVILNNHTSKSQWCCSNTDGDGLWWSKEYPEESFFECLKVLARRYKDNPRVIGMDLRNEIRIMNYRHYPSWGSGNPKTDWHQAAEKIGNDIQDICPHWLIMVGGISYQLDLTGAYTHPVRLHIPNKLVYTGHIYGFSWVGFDWRMDNYEEFREKMWKEQLFVRGLGVPYYLGEFGDNSRSLYWEYLIRLLKETDIDWTYWCLDGYKCQYEDETYGIWDRYYKNPRHPEMLRDLLKVGRPTKGLTVHAPIQQS